MPRNGNGTYSPVPSSWNPAINGNAATAPDWNALLTDISNALTQSVSRDGQSPMTANLSMGGNRIINVGQPVDDNDALRRAQVVKGADLASAATLGIPIEGSLFDVTGTTTITSLSDVYPGRTVLLRFTGVLTLTNSANLRLPTGSNIRTAAGDIGAFVNTSFGVWACYTYQEFIPAGNQPWLNQPIGVPFPIWDHLAGVPIPPTDSSRFRYIRLGADDDYNDGVLINQSMSGTYPNVIATAQISLEASPMNGQVVPLINTERTFLRPGASGVREANTFLAHTHAITVENAGEHRHWVSPPYSNNPNNGGNTVSGNDGSSEPIVAYLTDPSGVHSHGASASESGGEETRPNNRGATMYMRIL